MRNIACFQFFDNFSIFLVTAHFFPPDDLLISECVETFDILPEPEILNMKLEVTPCISEERDAIRRLLPKPVEDLMMDPDGKRNLECVLRCTVIAPASVCWLECVSTTCYYFRNNLMDDICSACEVFLLIVLSLISRLQ